jgi:hypothetical protein
MVAGLALMVRPSSSVIVSPGGAPGDLRKHAAFASKSTQVQAKIDRANPEPKMNRTVQVPFEWRLL